MPIALKTPSKSNIAIYAVIGIFGLAILYFVYRKLSNVTENILIEPNETQTPSVSQETVQVPSNAYLPNPYLKDLY